jgi:hypothetical protein
LYYTQEEQGSYHVLKLLKIDDGGFHVRLYSNEFAEPPASLDETRLYRAGRNHKPTEKPGMGHCPVSRKSFLSWDATFIQQSTVNPEELEGYNLWREANGGYF